MQYIRRRSGERYAHVLFIYLVSRGRTIYTRSPMRTLEVNQYSYRVWEMYLGLR
jgi:hypothetical protein